MTLANYRREDGNKATSEDEEESTYGGQEGTHEGTKGREDAPFVQ